MLLSLSSREVPDDRAAAFEVTELIRLRRFWSTRCRWPGRPLPRCQPPTQRIVARCGKDLMWPFNSIQSYSAIPLTRFILKAVPTLGFGPRAELWGRPRQLKWSNEISRFLSSLRPVDGFLYRPFGIDKLPCRSVLSSSKSALKSRLYMSAACGTWSSVGESDSSLDSTQNCCTKALDPARWGQTANRSVSCKLRNDAAMFTMLLSHEAFTNSNQFFRKSGSSHSEQFSPSRVPACHSGLWERSLQSLTRSSKTGLRRRMVTAMQVSKQRTAKHVSHDVITIIISPAKQCVHLCSLVFSFAFSGHDCTPGVYLLDPQLIFVELNR